VESTGQFRSAFTRALMSTPVDPMEAAYPMEELTFLPPSGARATR